MTLIVSLNHQMVALDILEIKQEGGIEQYGTHRFLKSSKW
jgi:hypothetical protein